MCVCNYAYIYTHILYVCIHMYVYINRSTINKLIDLSSKMATFVTEYDTGTVLQNQATALSLYMSVCLSENMFEYLFVYVRVCVCLRVFLYVSVCYISDYASVSLYVSVCMHVCVCLSL